MLYSHPAGLVRQLMRGFGIAVAKFEHRSVTEGKSQAHRMAEVSRAL
jgi:hypothetical protein